jgi:biopolymer transport protein ExbB
MNPALLALVADALLWPVLCCSVAALALAIERLTVLGRGRMEGGQTVARLRTVIRKGEPAELLTFAGDKQVPVAALLREFASTWARDGVPAPSSFERAASGELARLERGIGFLASLAILGPVLGSASLLLGLAGRSGATLLTIADPPLAAACLGVGTAVVSHLAHTIATGRVRTILADMEQIGAGLFSILDALPSPPTARARGREGEDDEFFRPKG